MTRADIEKIIIETLVDEKAYDLPSVCEKYNMAYGTEDEAFKSKRVYISKRLKGKSNLFTLDLADRVAKDYSLKELRKAIAKYNMRKLKINGNIRRELLDELYGLKENIEGELHIIPFLNRIWDLKRMPSIYRSDRNFEEDVLQHMVRNDDWDYTELLDTHLDVVGADDNIFTAFLETLVHPVVRKGSKQREVVALINSYIKEDEYELIQSGNKLGMPIFKVVSTIGGVDGQVKNIIFSADGSKPELVFTDAMNNDIQIVKYEENCLIFEKPIPESGLKWEDLVHWWEKSSYHDEKEVNVERELYKRLRQSLDSEPEKFLFKQYYKLFKDKLGENLPALIPQVYLHYDPKTLRQLKGKKRLVRQRMDFLLLLTDKHRIVIEVDGKQHYAEGEKVAPNLYSEMVAEDRRLKLAGYEIFRFGGYELTFGDKGKIVKDFFNRLFEKYDVKEP